MILNIANAKFAQGSHNLITIAVSYSASIYIKYYIFNIVDSVLNLAELLLNLRILLASARMQERLVAS